MGFVGQELGSEVGGLIGGYVGNKFKHKKQVKRQVHQQVQFGGSYLLFKYGGYINKTQPALLHKRELVVPKHLVKHVRKSLKNKIKHGGGRNMC